MMMMMQVLTHQESRFGVWGREESTHASSLHETQLQTGDDHYNDDDDYNYDNAETSLGIGRY